MWTTSFWKDTAERVVSAFVTSLLGVLGTAEAADLHAIQWKQALIAAAVIAGLTLLKCLGAGTGVVGQKGSPSLVAPAAPASDPAAGERLAEPTNVKVGGFTGGGQSGLLPPPTTRATGTVKLGDAGASTAPPD